MANLEQLEILKQGAEVWNEWRRANLGVEIDLVEANLRGADFSLYNLIGADLTRANLQETNFNGAELHGANFSGANLTEAILLEVFLSEANFNKADLSEANLRRANLSRANFNEALLRKVDLRGADLHGANLAGADLYRADMNGADLSGADLSEAFLLEADLNRAVLVQSVFRKATIGITIFGNSDLSKAIGLEDVMHNFPSSISTDAFSLSKGNIPRVFLQGCGLSDWEIESTKLYNPQLSSEEKNNILYRMYELLAGRALQVSALFISYSHSDSAFVDKLESYLNQKGVRFWRDVRDMKSGRMERQIDRAIRQNPTVLLILSEHSIKSDWVEHEVRTARALEKEMERDVLCPIALDDSWKNSPWPKRLMSQLKEYNILDFSEWKDDHQFGTTFNKLIDGLELFYK